MLFITGQQMQALGAHTQAQFVQTMVAHMQAFSPVLCGVLGPPQTHTAVQQAVDRARTQGFTLVGPIRLWVELSFLRGSGWHADPQYRRAQAALAQDGPEMLRAQALRDEYAAYQAQVCGPQNRHVLAALQALHALASQALAPPGPNPQGALRAQLVDLYPRKAAYVGDDGLDALVQAALQQARHSGFATLRQVTLLLALMYAFGSGCCTDPLYPWIQRTLDDPRLPDAPARAGRLERKALTWLEHVLARAPAPTA